jgi:transglutaminase-like putative cysteine protease
MKRLSLTLKLSDLGETTHIWFPAPQSGDDEIKTWFNMVPTEIQTDKKYGNRIAYFYLSSQLLDKVRPWRTPRSDLKIKITADFPISGFGFQAVRPEKFLHSNRFVESDDKTITCIAKSLINGCSTNQEKARRCFDFVVSYLTYANPIRGLYSSLQALTDRQVDCGGFSTLLAALLRAVKIPARCVFGWALRSKFGYHAWVEYFDSQKKSWISVDPSAAHLGDRANLDDKVTLSVGEDIDLVGNKIRWTTPLLQSPIVVSLDKFDIPVAMKENINWAF